MRRAARRGKTRFRHARGLALRYGRGASKEVLAMKPILAVLAAIVAAPAALAPAARAQAPQSPVAAGNARFEQAFNTGNVAALAALYTEHATVLPPGAPMQNGRAAIQQFWQGAIQSGLKNLSLKTVSFETYGNAGREIGTFTMDAPGQGGQAGGQVAHLAGKYVVVWKREGRQWHLDTDIWNTNS
jgi:ketosteroid isomerase-like protein